jgi:hypothetical protein
MMWRGGRLGERGTVAPASEGHGIYLAYLWLVAGPIGRVWRRMFRHRHRLLPAQVSHPPMAIAAALGLPAVSPVRTLVLLLCACGEGAGHMAEIPLAGYYTLEQVLGIEPDEAAHPDGPDSDTTAASTAPAITA